MKWRMLGLGLLLSGQIMSASKAGRKDHFPKFKQQMLERMETRIKYMNEAKTCVNNASDMQTLKNCRKRLRQNMDAFRKETREKRRAERLKRKAEREKMRAERKKNKGQK